MNPRLRDETLFAELQAQWQAERCLRIEDFMDGAAAREIRDALRAEAHTLTSEPAWVLSYQFFRFSWQAEENCDHGICRFGRWWKTDAVAWINRLTGRDLVVDPHKMMHATLYGKGCFLEPHNDYDGRRQIAYVVGLTEDSWPRTEGGHLEMLRADRVEHQAPGFGSLDLFDVSDEATAPTHRIPLLTRPVERRAFGGWLVEEGE